MFTLLSLFFCVAIVNSKCKDYYRIAFFSDTHIGLDVEDECSTSPAWNLKDSIEKINEFKEKDDSLLLAINLGDVGDGSRDGEEAVELYSKLSIPLIPIPGNHDIKMYNDQYNIGADRFKTAFQSIYGNLTEAGIIVDNTMDIDVTPSFKSSFGSFNLVNFEVRIPGFENDVVFLAVDYTHRYDPTDPNEYDYRAEAHLHDYEGGTIRWIEDKVKEIASSSAKHIVFLQHHAFYTYPSDWDWDNKLRLYFTDQDFLKFADVIKTAAGANVHKVVGDFAGHIHLFRDHHPFSKDGTWREHPDVSGLDHFRELIIDDSKCVPHFAIVEVNLTEGAELFTVHEDSFPEPLQCDDDYPNSSFSNRGFSLFLFVFIILLAIILG